jgi:CubicO group peptidase (beta-lactamase class C family)
VRLGQAYGPPVDDLQGPVDAAVEGRAFSGVVRVDRPGEPVWERAYGLAHRGYEVPNTTGTRFAVASGGKGFTALAVMSLVDEGVLGLGTTAREHLGDDLPLVPDDVTVEQLLAHRSGIGDYLDEDDDLPTDAYVLRRPVHEYTDVEAFVPELDGFAPKFAPGERFSYCNGGFVVLALVAQRASGRSYHDLVRERVVEPAGLSHTGFLRSDEPGPLTATHYLDETGPRTNVFHLPVLGSGDGGIFTTAADLRTFWTAFLAGRIVASEQVREMVRPRSDVPDEGMRYGLGFWLAPEGDAVHLVGGDAGVSFRSAHDPATDVTWSVLGNSSNGAWPVARAVMEVLGQPA